AGLEEGIQFAKRERSLRTTEIPVRPPTLQARELVRLRRQLKVNAIKKLLVTIAFATMAPAVAAQPAALIESIASRTDRSWEIALKIWDFAEPGYQEKRSAALLADTLEKAGFKV